MKIFRAHRASVLPFGFSSAPYIFTSILKPLQKSWRSQGIPVAIFLDDGLGGGTDFVSTKVNNLVVHSDLLKSGFVLWGKVPLGASPSYRLVGCDSRHYWWDYKSNRRTYWKVKRWLYWAASLSTYPESARERSRHCNGSNNFPLFCRDGVQ